MKVLKNILFLLFPLCHSAVTFSQTQTSQITAALVDLGNGSFKVTFTPNQALSGTALPLNVYIKVPIAQFTGTSLAITSNPFGLGSSGNFDGLNSSGYFTFQSANPVSIETWSVGVSQDIITFTSSGPATQFNLSGGDFGTGVFIGGGYRWAGTALTVNNTEINLVAWPINSSISLPVELTHFRASLRPDATTLLDWRTESETDNEGFFVERSLDGKNWKDLGFVAGGGTTASPQEYRFIDESPRPGINYYRLRQMDFDGSFEYSKVASVELGKDGHTLDVFPNPANNKITVRVPAMEYEAKLEIFDQLGRVAWSGKIEAGQLQSLQIDLAEGQFDNGVYLVTLTTNYEKMTERVVISK